MTPSKNTICAIVALERYEACLTHLTCGRFARLIHAPALEGQSVPSPAAQHRRALDDHSYGVVLEQQVSFELRLFGDHRFSGGRWFDRVLRVGG